MAKDQWWIRNVPEMVKRKIAARAKLHGLDIGEEIAKMLEIVEKMEGKAKPL